MIIIITLNKIYNYFELTKQINNKDFYKLVLHIDVISTWII